MLVYNKIDVADPLELRALEREFRDAAFVCATRRETTRPLIERIARELADKWESSAKGPNVEPEPSADVQPEPGGGDPEEMTTVDDMLRAAGKRVRSRVG